MPSISTGIIDFALSPPIGLLTSHLDANGPYGPGNHTNTTWKDGATVRNVNDTFGVQLNFNGAIPSKLGLTIGYDDGALVVMDEFDMRLVQLVVQHQLASGVWVVTQLEDIHAMPLVVRWAEALPGRVGLYVAPGIHVDLFYLLVG
jgi:hypothetical protein